MQITNNIYNYKDIINYSKIYNISSIDIIMIAMNRYGVCANISDSRLRFKFCPSGSNEIYYMALCINTYNSPFHIVGDEVRVNDVSVGKIFDIEKDTCDSTYFRRNKTELTLNSNVRSQCKGCTFCGTYNLDPEDRIDMSDDKKIEGFFKTYMEQHKLEDLSRLVRITVCTGCFSNEAELVNHLISVYKVVSKFGFNKRIRYIGSQIKSDHAMTLIQNAIPYFSLSLTVECFTNRKSRMRKEKANLDMGTIQDILTRSMEHCFSTNYLYIVGLDSIDTMRAGIKQLSPYVNRMPVFQIMQNYVEKHETQRTKEAEFFEYYLKARQIIESIFKDIDVSPRSWENYRGLFYTTYQDKPLQCIRI